MSKLVVSINHHGKRDTFATESGIATILDNGQERYQMEALNPSHASMAMAFFQKAKEHGDFVRLTDLAKVGGEQSRVVFAKDIQSLAVVG